MSPKPRVGTEQGTTNGTKPRILVNMCKHWWYGGTYGTQKLVVKQGPYEPYAAIKWLMALFSGQLGLYEIEPRWLIECILVCAHDNSQLIF